MAYTYDPMFAKDPANPANVAKSASITIFDPADPGKAPIAITDTTGSPLPNPITVDAFGLGPAFQHPTLHRVGWTGAGFTNYFTSYEGMYNEVLDAKAASEAAATSAATAGADAADAAAAGVQTALSGATSAAATSASAAQTAQNSAQAAQTAAQNAANLVSAPADSVIKSLFANPASESSIELSSKFARAVFEANGTYPARPAGAAIVIWVGASNPEAVMAASDIWVPTGGDANLTEAELVTLASSPTSAIGARLRETFFTRPLTTKTAAHGNGLWGVLGDSLATYGATRPSANTTGVSGSQNYNLPQGIAVESKGAVVLGYRTSTSFAGITPMLDQVAPMIASGVKYCIVFGVTGAGNVQDAAGVLKDVYTRLRAGGVEPVAVTMPTSDTAAVRDRWAGVNAWIRAYCQLQQIEVWDIAKAVTDPATGNYKTNHGFSGNNLSALGHRAAVRSILPQVMAAHGGKPKPRLATSAIDVTNKFGDGLFLTAGATAGLSTMWTERTDTGTNGGKSYSLVPSISSDPVQGNWQRFTRASNAWGVSAITRSIPLATVGIVGNACVLSFAIKTSGYEAAGNGNFSVTVNFVGASAHPVVQFANSWNADLDGIMSERFSIPAGTTAVEVAITTSFGTAEQYVQVGGMQLTNLTQALGVDYTGVV